MASIKTIKFDEKKWQAQEDARTLAQYQEIMADKSRYNNAMKQVETRRSELNKELNSLSRISKSKGYDSKSTTKKKS